MRFDLLLVFAVALGARGLHAYALHSDPSQAVVIGDGAVYLAWADAIRGGALLGERAFYQDPLYPYTLALWRVLVGDSLLAVRVLHVLLGACAALLLASAGRAVGGPRVGLLAGALLALHPTAVFLEGLVQKTALVTLLVCATLAVAPCSAPAAARLRRWCGLGFVVGLWMLARGEARLAALALAVWLLVAVTRGGGRTGRALLAYVAGLALACAPALAHNVAVSGAWILTTAQAGPNLYIGNAAGSQGVYAPLIPGRGDARREAYDARRLAEEAEGRSLSDSEVSRHWLRRTFDVARADPAAAAQRVLRKLRLALSRAELPDTEDFASAVPRSPVLRALAPALHMGTLLPLACLGVLLAQRRARLAPALALAAAQLTALGLFYVFARYRFPLVPCALLCAAEGLSALPALRSAPRGRVLAAFAVAALGALAAAWPLPPELRPDDSLERYRRALSLVERGALAEAEPELAALVADRPGIVEAWTTLGIVRARLGRPAAAVPAFEAARRLSPEDPRLAGQLGTALAEAGRPEAAAEVLVAAALADPRHNEVASNAALLCLQLGRAADAVRVLAARVAAEPNDRGAVLQLAWLCATARDGAVRDGAAAVALLAPRCAAVGAPWARDPRALEVYAAALAADGAAAAAADVARRAAELARAAGDEALAARLAGRAAHFASGAALRE